jgi:DNA-directed RNA polymerase subunit RPC12/RpoP
MIDANIVDRYGNNAAVRCLACSQVFIVSQLLNKINGRLCPHCGGSRVTFSNDGGLKTEPLNGEVTSQERVREILRQVKPLAAEFYQLTQKPLGVTGEIAEFVAAERLGLTLTPARTVGHDALRGHERIQIKGRAFGSESKRSQRISRIKLDAPCDIVLLVLLDNKTLEPREMWEAPYSKVCDLLCRPGSKARERGALGVPAFKKIAKRVWPA